MSRIYLGLHTPFDIYGGLGVGILLVLLFILIGDYIVVWASNSASVFLLYPLYCMFMLWLYPRDCEKWTSSYGDATRALGTSMGVLFAAYLAYPGMQLKITPVAMMIPETNAEWMFVFSRIIVGMYFLQKHFNVQDLLVWQSSRNQSKSSCLPLYHTLCNCWELLLLMIKK